MRTKTSKQNSAFEFNYSATSQFNQLKSRLEEKMYNEFKAKINEFLSLMEDQDWKGKVPNDTHNDYIASIVEWLGANIQTLEIHNADIVYSCSFVCIQHL